MSHPYSADQRGKIPHKAHRSSLTKCRNVESQPSSSKSSAYRPVWTSSDSLIKGFKPQAFTSSGASSSRTHSDLRRNNYLSHKSSLDSKEPFKALPRTTSNSSNLSIAYAPALLLPKLPKFAFISQKKLTQSGPQENISSIEPSRNFSNPNFTEDEEVPTNSPPRQKMRQIRRKKGAAVSTEPTKTKRSGQAGTSRQAAGTLGSTENSNEDTDEEKGPLSLSCLTSFSNNLPQSPINQSKRKETLIGSVGDTQSGNFRDTSSLSSIPSDNERPELTPSHNTKFHNNELDTQTIDEKPIENHPRTLPQIKSRSPSPTDQNSHLGEQCQYSPVFPENIELDDPSELGDDVCLEYTDFGNDMGAPITWSGSEYDDGYQTDQSNEFAELLLAENSEQDNSFDINRSRNSRSHLNLFQLEQGGSDDSSDNYSQMAYMIIEELESRGATEVEQEVEGQNDFTSDDDGEDGATTDSLDEDDHSGMARFGIEVDDEGEENIEFYDLQADDALGSLLNNFEFAGDVEFFVLPDQEVRPGSLTAASSQVCSCEQGSTQEKSLNLNNDSRLPIMGSFSISRQDGKTAGCTIIDERNALSPSPFTGGKVVRYNQFKKLQSRSCAGDSAPSSVGTPQQSMQLAEQALGNSQPDKQNDSNISAEDFDITAFIRGISSLEEECSETEKAKEDSKLDYLSRWRRVPMTAFRRKMLAQTTPKGDHMALDAAIQSCSTLGENISLYEPASIKKQNARLLLSPPSKKSHRRGHRQNPKSDICGSGSGSYKRKCDGSENFSEKIDITWNEGKAEPMDTSIEEGVSIVQSLDVPLFDGLIETGSRGVPTMLNLLDGIEDLPID